ncbi:hypothetical protein GCM10027417_31360 [Glutamicibacter endophyticus]
MGQQQQNLPAYADRHDAGLRLAAELSAYHQAANTLILGLARGGLPIAATLAAELHLPFDALLVRKLGVPDYPELAFGAIAAHGQLQAEVILPELIDSLPTELTRPERLERVRQSETAELHRRQSAYLQGRATEVTGQTVILCDDGLATGATMAAAIRVMRMAHVGKLIAAIPVGPESTCASCAAHCDEFHCPLQPNDFGAVGTYYEHFEQLDDATVHNILRQAGST